MYCNKDIKVISTEALLVTFYVNFENGFACWGNFENHHPEKLIETSEIWD